MKKFIIILYLCLYSVACDAGEYVTKCSTDKRLSAMYCELTGYLESNNTIIVFKKKTITNLKILTTAMKRYALSFNSDEARLNTELKLKNFIKRLEKEDNACTYDEVVAINKILAFILKHECPYKTYVHSSSVLLFSNVVVSAICIVLTNYYCVDL